MLDTVWIVGYNNNKMMYGYDLKIHQSEQSQIADADLCRLAQAGDRSAEETLVCRYSRLVKACARPYFLAGADGEDLIQEGMLGLLKAVRGFDSTKGVPFEAFAHMCVTRRIFSAVKTAAGTKHFPLNQSTSIGEPLFDDNADVVNAASLPISDPMLLVIGMEEHRELKQQLSCLLSVFEAKVLELYLDGNSYEEMSVILNKPAKSVDNAIQRIRRKSAQYFSSRRTQASTCTHISNQVPQRDSQSKRGKKNVSGQDISM